MTSYFIHQKITLMANQYLIYAQDEKGEQGALVAFAHQKRLAFKEKVIFFADGSKQQIAFEVQARQVVDLGARYDVKDSKGTVLGTVGKAFGKSLLRSTWNIYDRKDEAKVALEVTERSKALAIIRRVWELLPVVGDIPFFVKYHFDFISQASNKVIATYNKETTFRDYYRLDIHDDALLQQQDWRTLVALGVLMDALQSR